MKNVLVIGGGAAGMMAAITAADNGAAVTLIERNQKVGRKLYITGKGRCNVTNHCSEEEFLRNVTSNSRFLYSSLSVWLPKDTEEFFENLGVKLKIERGNRVFPVSDHSSDIIDALYYRLKRHRVQIVQARIISLEHQYDGTFFAKSESGKEYYADAVILATGGVSYPSTGSSGDGLQIAERLGHTIVPCRASLSALIEDGDDCAAMQGLSLKNISVSVLNSKKKTIYTDFGELLFTHFGLSGPVILSASTQMKDYEKNRYTVVIDLKPALDEQKLDARILREIASAPNRSVSNMLMTLLPKSMTPVIIKRCNIDGEQRSSNFSKTDRLRLVHELKYFSVSIAGTRPIEEAIVTAGGVKTSEINPATMESKKVPGLYFAGEMIDVDAMTGGFNLQIAWTTGHAAGLHASEEG